MEGGSLVWGREWIWTCAEHGADLFVVATSAEKEQYKDRRGEDEDNGTNGAADHSTNVNRGPNRVRSAKFDGGSIDTNI